MEGSTRGYFRYDPLDCRVPRDFRATHGTRIQLHEKEILIELQGTNRGTIFSYSSVASKFMISTHTESAPHQSPTSQFAVC